MLQVSDGNPRIALQTEGNWQAAAFLPGDREVVLVGGEASASRVAFFSLGSGRVEREWAGGKEELAVAVGVDPRGSRIAFSEMNGNFYLWEFSSTSRPVRLGVLPSSWRTLAFSPDGRRIAIGSENGAVRIWDAALGREVLVLHDLDGSFQDLSFSADGRRILALGVDFDWTEGAPIIVMSWRGEQPSHRPM